MVCMYCGGTTHVINSRPQKRSNSVWRRRTCDHCTATVTTTEHVALESALMIKSSSETSPFNRDKLYLSIADSLRHLSNPAAAATEITHTVIQNLIGKAKHASLEHNDVITITADVLSRFDPAAGSHYRAFHKPR